MSNKNTRKAVNKKNNKNYKNTEIAGFLTVLFGLLSIVSIYFKKNTGLLGDLLGGLYFFLLGIGSYVFPFLLVLTLLRIIYGKFKDKSKKILICSWILFTLIIIYIATFSLSDVDFNLGARISRSIELANNFKSTGVLGGFLSTICVTLLGEIGTYILFYFLAIFTVLSFFDYSIMDSMKFLKKILTGFMGKIGQLLKSIFKKNTDKETLNKNRHNIDRIETGRVSSPVYDREISNKKKISLKRENDKINREFLQEAMLDKKDDTSKSKIAINNYLTNTEDDGDNRSIKNTTDKNKDKEVLENKELAKSQNSPLKVELNQLEIDRKLDSEDDGENYVVPPYELLRNPSKPSHENDDILMNKAKIIVKTLESFGIESEVVAIDRGPSVTQFQLKPALGVKVSKILNLSNDLALALAATQVRIEAPIPGKPYVGIEVPNKSSDMVTLKEILTSQTYINSHGNIPVCLGKGISGEPIVANIDEMPHLLIAGATGSGKSICVNAIIMSLLFKFSPKDLKLLLIDPKVVELSNYNDIPHLISKVVTDPMKAASALKSIEKLMDERYETFAKYRVKDIKSYKIKKENSEEDMPNLPYILVIIDELADLMMTSAKSVETSIARLAQLARACGIHLIIATQRPSVDVITGLIKANIPSRISFQVSSQIDSRTILDQSGAEKLLGRGDMLYYPSSFPKPLRVQGAFISDKEVLNITNFIKSKNESDYDKDFIKDISQKVNESINKEDRDELLDEVIEFIVDQGQCSISALQRRFSIGYARAGRIVDYLEQAGYISGQDGSKPREVFTNKIEKVENRWMQQIK